MLESNGTEAIAFDSADLAARLGRLRDPRHKQGKVYPLGMILAKLAGTHRAFNAQIAAQLH